MIKSIDNLDLEGRYIIQITNLTESQFKIIVESLIDNRERKIQKLAKDSLLDLPNKVLKNIKTEQLNKINSISDLIFKLFQDAKSKN